MLNSSGKPANSQSYSSSDYSSSDLENISEREKSVKSGNSKGSRREISPKSTVSGVFATEESETPTS